MGKGVIIDLRTCKIRSDHEKNDSDKLKLIEI